MTDRCADLDFRPLMPDRWRDLEALFGSKGGCGGCWCMWYRLPRAEYEAGKGQVNRRRFLERVKDRARSAPGVLAYAEPGAIGWCAVAPREEYARLRTTRTLRAPDDQPAWAILCLFVSRPWRSAGVSVRLIDAATQFAFERGALVVEAYPVVPRDAPIPPVFASLGTLSAYLRAGYEVVSRPSEARAVVRRFRNDGAG